MPATAEEVRPAPRSARTETRRRPESARVRRTNAAEVKRQALVDRLAAKAAQADDTSTWRSLAGMSDDDIIAALTRG